MTSFFDDIELTFTCSMCRRFGTVLAKENNKSHRHRLKVVKRIFKTYQQSPIDVLEVIDKEQLLFHVKSETLLTFWYSVSLKTYFCNCPDILSTCKHISGLQSIVKEFFKVPKINEVMEDTFLMIPEMKDIDIRIPSQIDVPMKKVSYSGVMHGKALKALSEMTSLRKIFIGEHNEEKTRFIQEVLQTCLTSLQKTSRFERQNMISLPKRGSISIFSLQENVKRTRMRHEKKYNISEVGERSTPRPPLKRSTHMLLSHSKQKRVIFRKLLKVTCDI